MTPSDKPTDAQLLEVREQAAQWKEAFEKTKVLLANRDAALSTSEASRLSVEGERDGLRKVLEEVLPLAEMGFYLWDECSFSAGNRRTEPEERSIAWEWQQSLPDDYAHKAMRAAVEAFIAGIRDRAEDEPYLLDLPIIAAREALSLPVGAGGKDSTLSQDPGPHPCGEQPTAIVEKQDLHYLLADAYEDGAKAVHDIHSTDPYPEFGEAASDYAISVIDNFGFAPAPPFSPREQPGADVAATAAPAQDPVAVAREAFLNMIADAERFDEDVDGDAHPDGGPDIITVRYHLTTGDSQLDELVDALGFKRAYDQSAMDVITQALDEALPLASAGEAQ